MAILLDPLEARQAEPPQLVVDELGWRQSSGSAIHRVFLAGDVKPQGSEVWIALTLLAT